MQKTRDRPAHHRSAMQDLTFLWGCFFLTVRETEKLSDTGKSLVSTDQAGSRKQPTQEVLCGGRAVNCF